MYSVPSLNRWLPKCAELDDEAIAILAPTASKGKKCFVSPGAIVTNAWRHQYGVSETKMSNMQSSLKIVGRCLISGENFDYAVITWEWIESSHLGNVERDKIMDMVASGRTAQATAPWTDRNHLTITAIVHGWYEGKREAGDALFDRIHQGICVDWRSRWKERSIPQGNLFLKPLPFHI